MKVKNVKLEEEIDGLDSTYTDWEYVENIFEALEDADCLTGIGKRFRRYIWEKYIKSKGTYTG